MEAKLIAIIAILVSAITAAFVKLIDYILNHFRHSRMEKIVAEEKGVVSTLVSSNVEALTKVAERLEDLDGDLEWVRNDVVSTERLLHEMKSSCAVCQERMSDLKNKVLRNKGGQ